MTPSQDTSSHTSPTRHKEKVTRALWDTDFFLTPSIQFLIQQFGAAGPTYYMRIALAILADGGALYKLIAKSFITHLGADEETANRFFEACIEVGLLYIDETGKFYRSERADLEIATLKAKRDAWRKRQRRHRDSQETHADVTRDSLKSHGDSEYEYEEELESSSLNNLDLNTKDLTNDLNTNTKDLNISKGIPKAKDKPTPTPKVRHRNYVFLTEAEHSKLVELHGEVFVERCIEKLDAWIEQNPVPKRLKNGRNASATFRAWVLNAVSEEQARAGRSQAPARTLSVHDRNTETVRKIIEEERAKQMFGEPKEVFEI